jgi:hypothetical protein
MLLAVTSIKLVAEIALMAFVGQWVLGLLAGQKRDSNLFYQLLAVLTKPFVKGVRLITPRVVLDRHIPLAAFTLLAMVWVVVTIVRIQMCLEIGVQLCR